MVYGLPVELASFKGSLAKYSLFWRIYENDQVDNFIDIQLMQKAFFLYSILGPKFLITGIWYDTC